MFNLIFPLRYETINIECLTFAGAAAAALAQALQSLQLRDSRFRLNCAPFGFGGFLLGLLGRQLRLLGDGESAVDGVRLAGLGPCLSRGSRWQSGNRATVQKRCIIICPRITENYVGVK